MKPENTPSAFAGNSYICILKFSPMKLPFKHYFFVLLLLITSVSFSGCAANKKHRCGDCPRWDK